MYGRSQGIFFGLEGRVEVGGGYVGGSFNRKLLMGAETFNEGGAGFFLALFKKTMKK